MNTVVPLRDSRSEKPTVRGGRAKNADYRQREYLTEGEIDTLLVTAGNSRNPVRDRLLILMIPTTQKQPLVRSASTRWSGSPRE